MELDYVTIYNSHRYMNVMIFGINIVCTTNKTTYHSKCAIKNAIPSSPNGEHLETSSKIKKICLPKCTWNTVTSDHNRELKFARSHSQMVGSRDSLQVHDDPSNFQQNLPPNKFIPRTLEYKKNIHLLFITLTKQYFTMVQYITKNMIHIYTLDTQFQERVKSKYSI